MLPLLLIYFRATLGPCFLIGFWLGADPRFHASLLAAGITSDVADGVLARRWGCSTPGLRRFDSNVDTIFYGCAAIVAALSHATYLFPWRLGFLVMFAFLIAQNVTNAVRYGRQPAYHMWSGKLWSVALAVALTALFLGHPSPWAVNAVVALGIINSIEGMVASLTLPLPLTDIPSMFHAVRLAGKRSP